MDVCIIQRSRVCLCINRSLVEERLARILLAGARTDTILLWSCLELGPSRATDGEDYGQAEISGLFAGPFEYSLSDSRAHFRCLCAVESIPALCSVQRYISACISMNHRVYCL